MPDAESLADAVRQATGRLIREQGASRGREVASGVRGAWRETALDVASAADLAAAAGWERRRSFRRSARSLEAAVVRPSGEVTP